MASDPPHVDPCERCDRLEARVQVLEAELEQCNGRLTRSLSQYEALFEHAPDALLVIDQNDAIRRANALARELTGYSALELATMSLSTLVGAIPEQRLVYSGRDLYRLGKKDGTTRTVELTRQQTAEDHIQVVIRDVTEQIEAELELLRITSNLEEAQARIRLGSWELNLETLSGYWSDEMFRLVGRDKALGIPALHEFMEHVHPEDRPAVRETHESVVKAAVPGAYHVIEYRTSEPDPETQRRLRAEFYYQPHGKEDAPVLIGTTLDITELARAERQALEREESIRATLQSIGDAVIATDEFGLVTRMNPVAAKMTGWTVDEARGRPLGEVFQIFHAETGEPAESPVERVLATGEIVGLANDTMLRSRDGSTYQIADSGAPIRDQAGRILGVVLVFRDVTEAYRIQERLRDHMRKRSEAHNFLINVLDAIPVRVYWKDAQLRYSGGNILFARDAGIGHPGGLIGKTDAEMPWRNEAELAERLERLVLEDAESYLAIEEERVIGSGAQLIVRSNRVPLRNLEGQIVGVLGTYEDITRSKQAEEEGIKLEAQLRQAQKLETIGTLAGGIAHDFNNILTPILGYSDLALASLSEGDPGYRELHEIYGAARRAKELVRHILAFSRQVDREITAVSLPDVIEEALGLLRPLIPANVAIQRDIPDATRPILADATQIHQVVVNLCTNAYQAMKEGGVLHLGLREHVIERRHMGRHERLQPGVYLRLSISDTGTGMDAMTAARVFEPFFTTKAVNEGTGLGLSVAYGIVRSLNGDIRIESEQGIGTTMHVYLPAIVSESAAPSQQAGRGAMPAGGSEHLLVVDDESAVLDVIGRMLLRLGYVVHTQHDPAQVLDMLKKSPHAFDLVLTDLTMPGMTGIQLATGIKEAFPDLPIVLMTGYGTAVNEEKRMRLNIEHVLYKPIELGDLAHAIRQTLDAARH
ncbi:MAG: PAS domain S-box protein [Rhodothermales bacterium]